MIIALSTSVPKYEILYSHAKELAAYLKKNLELDLLAKYYSDAMQAEAFVDSEGIANLRKVEFHSVKGRSDLVLLSGDSSPISQNFKFSEAILKFAADLGVNQIYSIGTRWIEPPENTINSNVLGFATDRVGVKLLREADVTVTSGEYSPYFSSTVVGVAKLQGMRGYRLSVNHGEPRPHPRSIAALVRILSRLLKLKIDTSDLDEYASRIEQNHGPIKADHLKKDGSEIYR